MSAAPGTGSPSESPALLRFRRQFLVTPRAVELPGWRHERVDGHNVYAHPELSMTVHRSDGGGVLVLLGFAIDPDHPERDDAAVLECLADDRARGVEQPTIDRLSGRFVLFVFDGAHITVQADAAGARAVEYTFTGDEFHAASQSFLLAEAVPLSEGRRAALFRGSLHARLDREAFLPADVTLFDGVHRLLPNHRLDAAERRQVRVWPVEPVAPASLGDAAAFAARQLSASIDAASYRFPLSLPLTAGYDSRALLAATPRSRRSRVFVYTLLYRHLGRFSADAHVASRVARQAKLQHHLVECRADPGPEWRRLYTGNSPLAHYDDWGVIARGMYTGLPGGHVALKGNASEIVRTFYWRDGVAPRVRSAADILALHSGWSELPFVVQAVERWFEATEPIARASGVAIDDLFYWEHRCGSWQAQSQLEWDIAQETFMPFGNRRLLARLLGVPAADRADHGQALLHEIMRLSDPELLELPFNPSGGGYRAVEVLLKARHRVRRGLRRLRTA
ncbi:MAG: hypothetical protein J0I18_19990 [Actinobacteria bacterium]|nr:hypothetical protein [Actinomycetota bacterium]